MWVLLFTPHHKKQTKEQSKINFCEFETNNDSDVWAVETPQLIHMGIFHNLFLGISRSSHFFLSKVTRALAGWMTYHKHIAWRRPWRCRLHCAPCKCIVPGLRAVRLRCATYYPAEHEIVLRASCRCPYAMPLSALDRRLTIIANKNKVEKRFENKFRRLVNRNVVDGLRHANTQPASHDV